MCFRRARISSTKGIFEVPICIAIREIAIIKGLFNIGGPEEQEKPGTKKPSRAKRGADISEGCAAAATESLKNKEEVALEGGLSTTDEATDAEQSSNETFWLKLQEQAEIAKAIETEMMRQSSKPTAERPDKGSRRNLVELYKRQAELEGELDELENARSSAKENPEKKVRFDKTIAGQSISEVPTDPFREELGIK